MFLYSMQHSWIILQCFKAFPPAVCEHALKRSGLDAFVREKGAEYLCGENGCLLSGGEKQRISIARGFIRNAQILMMDEATAALDTATARYVEESILHLDDVTAIGGLPISCMPIF